MTHQAIETLEPRFREPENWRWHVISKSADRKIRVGSVFPDAIKHNGKRPEAMIVCLPGLSEFGEKYFELAHWALSKNMAFSVIDWVGQGLSSRYLKNPHKRHSTNFDEDINDLDLWIKQYVLRSAVVTDEGRLPMVMLAHSMGGNIGIRYLQKHPDVFDYAAFSAPMLGIKALSCMPVSFAKLITHFFKKKKGEDYVPGGSDWALQPDVSSPLSILTSDAKRGTINNIYSQHNEGLRIGNVTYQWIYDALQSCLLARGRKALKSIKVPVLLSYATQETLISNTHIKRAAKIIPHVKSFEIKGSKHEILMERDEIRDQFINAFYSGIQEHIISSSQNLKRF